MGKVIELSDQHYAIMSTAAAERGESADVLMTHWLRDLASGSANPNRAKAADALPPVAITSSATTGTTWQRAWLRGYLAAHEDDDWQPGATSDKRQAEFEWQAILGATSIGRLMLTARRVCDVSGTKPIS